MNTRRYNPFFVKEIAGGVVTVVDSEGHSVVVNKSVAIICMEFGLNFSEIHAIGMHPDMSFSERGPYLKGDGTTGQYGDFSVKLPGGFVDYRRGSLLPPVFLNKALEEKTFTVRSELYDATGLQNGPLILPTVQQAALIAYDTAGEISKTIRADQPDTGAPILSFLNDLSLLYLDIWRGMHEGRLKQGDAPPELDRLVGVYRTFCQAVVEMAPSAFEPLNDIYGKHQFLEPERRGLPGWLKKPPTYES